jgi:hypothetical protein
MTTSTSDAEILGHPLRVLYESTRARAKVLGAKSEPVRVAVLKIASAIFAGDEEKVENAIRAFVDLYSASPEAQQLRIKAKADGIWIDFRRAQAASGGTLPGLTWSEMWRLREGFFRARRDNSVSAREEANGDA